MAKCLRCGREWKPKVACPKECPSCHIKNWNVPESSPYRLKTGHHGCTHHPLYHVWNSMMRRCTQPHHHAYADYGGRGITVSNEWMDIRAFIKDMYPGYIKGMTLDRIDNNKGYSKYNCRWANISTQHNNMRSNSRIELFGETKNLMQWLKHYKIKKPTYQGRRRRGWRLIEAIITPVGEVYSHPQTSIMTETKGRGKAG